MAAYSQNVNNSQAIPSTLALIVMGLLGFLSVNVQGQSISLTWLPIMALALWPRNIHPVLSIIIFMIVGLLVDWGSAGAPGQWGIVYLSIFMVLRPDRRMDAFGFVGALRNWFIAMLITAFVFTLTGWFVYGLLPDFASMAYQAGIATLILPIFYFIRYGVRSLFTDDEHDY